MKNKRPSQFPFSNSRKIDIVRQGRTWINGRIVLSKIEWRAWKIRKSIQFLHKFENLTILIKDIQIIDWKITRCWHTWKNAAEGSACLPISTPSVSLSTGPRKRFARMRYCPGSCLDPKFGKLFADLGLALKLSHKLENSGYAIFLLYVILNSQESIEFNFLEFIKFWSRF